MSEAKPTPTRGVAVELDRTRYLRYPLSVLKKLQAEGSDRTLSQILLLGLKADDPELTIDKIEEMIDLENLKVLFDPVKKATGGMVDLSKIFKTMVDEQGPQTPAPAPGGAS